MKWLFTFVLAVSFFDLSAQNLPYVRQLTDTLSSERYEGRGYVRSGGKKAAALIKSEFEKNGLSEVQYQSFNHPINIFPGEMELSGDGQPWRPGIDYIVHPSSNGCGKSSLQTAFLDSVTISSKKAFFKWIKKINWENSALVIPKKLHAYVGDKSIGVSLSTNSFGAKAIITSTEDKLTWSVRSSVKEWVEVEVVDSIIDGVKKVSLDIEQEFNSNFSNQNVLGYVQGKSDDSLIVYTAHYDHLGRMGLETCFYGANDNAGGAAMLCDLARHFAKPENRPTYSMLFIAFAAEEAGLIGSKYYTEHPVFPMEKISLLVNLDLVTTGEDGITIVNGRIFKQLTKKLERINADKEYMKAIKKRGKAANSDHYWFSEGGIKAIFIYLQGEYPHYHDINDSSDKPNWAGYEGFFKLLVDLTASWPN